MSSKETPMIGTLRGQHTRTPLQILSMGLFLILSMVPSEALTIIPVFDSSITSDAHSDQIQQTIRDAIQVYQSSFSDSVVVTIQFMESQSGLGNSSYGYISVTYSEFRSALIAHATTSYDAAAVAHLPSGEFNPVNGDRMINVQFANARALGLMDSSTAGQMDGMILLNTSIMNLDRTSIDHSKWDLKSVASHEIDEVLGLTSALDGLTNGAAVPTDAVWPMDLFRYDPTGTGTRSFDTSASSEAYFSVDGIDNLVRFNQIQGGDFHDWYGWVSGVVPQVQDSSSLSGATPDLGIEKIALDVIGYQLVVSSLAPKASIISTGASSVSITWNSIPALIYQPQVSTDLTSGSWINFGNAVTATNTTTSISDPVGATPNRYYRVLLQP